jgi:hypothetical protein
MYFLEAMLAGIVSENWAGTDVAISVIPIGSCPTTATWVKAMLTGEVTVTEIVCPGFTTVPSAGEEIWSAGGFCCAADSCSETRRTKIAANLPRELHEKHRFFV